MGERGARAGVRAGGKVRGRGKGEMGPTESPTGRGSSVGQTPDVHDGDDKPTYKDDGWSQLCAPRRHHTAITAEKKE